MWHRQAWYLPERGMAMEGWYTDRDCKIANGLESWYYPNRNLKSAGKYVNGKKEGLWVIYDSSGHLVDSATYVAGRLSGIRLQWNKDGILTDSMQFDGAGNGVEVQWFDNGNLSSAGYWVSDTMPKGRWKYYRPDGQLLATVDYVAGKRIACNCFDVNGQPLDSALCSENEAKFSTDSLAWRNFIIRHLNPDVPVRKLAPLGQYTVVVQFVVDTTGAVTQIEPLTHFGYGMEEEVIRMLKASPQWIPARQFGRKVKAYRRQPITFEVSRS